MSTTNKRLISSIDVVNGQGFKTYYVGQAGHGGGPGICNQIRFFQPPDAPFPCYRGLDENGNVLYEIRALKQCNIHYKDA